jgi:transcription initiation factor TFIIB
LVIRGRSISALVSGAVYVSCREIGIPRTLKDVAAAGNLKRKDLARQCRLIIRELDLRVPMADPMKCIVKIANKANLSETITRMAMNMMTQIIQRGISAGKNPMSLAATVLYISSIKVGVNITQLDIASAAGITEVTIRNRIHELKKIQEPKTYSWGILVFHEKLPGVLFEYYWQFWLMTVDELSLGKKF